MTVTAPPRPPRPSDPVDREEIEALVEALIEEARQRQRRRRRIYWALAAAVAFVSVVVFTTFERTARSQSGAGAAPARDGLAVASAPSRIAFIHNGSPMSRGVHELRVVNTDGSGQQKVTRIGSLSVGIPTWSPDGRKIAFLRFPSGHPQVYVVNADGSGQRRLTRSPQHDLHPVWSPDGRRIAFVRAEPVLCRVGQPCAGNTEIYVMNVDGSHQRNLTRDAARDSTPSWSPDGRRIAFQSDRDGNLEMYVMNADGTGLLNLTQNAAFDGIPFIQHSRAQLSAWSPDGRRIAFQSDRDGNREIYIVSADGSGQKRLTSHAAADGDPAWSPDGRKIAFVRGTRRNQDIFVMNADGSEQKRLTRDPASDLTPAWSPDGRQIAFLSQRDRNPEIYVMNSDGSGQTRLTRNGTTDDSIAWSPAQK